MKNEGADIDDDPDLSVITEALTSERNLWKPTESSKPEDSSHSAWDSWSYEDSEPRWSCEDSAPRWSYEDSEPRWSYHDEKMKRQADTEVAVQNVPGSHRTTEAWRPRHGQETGRWGNRGGAHKEWYTQKFKAENKAKRVGQWFLDDWLAKNPKPKKQPKLVHPPSAEASSSASSSSAQRRMPQPPTTPPPSHLKRS